MIPNSPGIFLFYFFCAQSTEAVQGIEEGRVWTTSPNWANGSGVDHPRGRVIPAGPRGRASVAENVAGAGLEGFAFRCMATRQTVENATPYKGNATRLNNRAILWEQRVGGSNPSAPTIRIIA